MSAPKTLVIFSLFLLCIGQGFGQQGEWKTVYSDELHFFANFPDEPKQDTVHIALQTGDVVARRWRSEFPGVAYEVLVADFPNIDREIQWRELSRLYSQVCIDIGGSGKECQGFAGNDLFGERGVMGEFRTSDGTVSFTMFLTAKRLYMARVEAHKSVDNRIRDDRKKFLDDFLFLHIDEKEKKPTWGLPKSESQNCKDC